MPGRPEETKELHRESRSFALLDRWRPDIRLALRLLVKHRGLSLAGGDRVVAFWIDGLAPEDEDVRPFDQLLATGATRSTFQNLVPRTGAPEPVLVAEVTPAAFSVAHWRPFIGRALVRDDARAGGSPRLSGRCVRRTGTTVDNLPSVDATFSIVGDIRAVETIATGRGIHILERLNKLYGKESWRKLKGIATVRLPDGTMAEAEVHWFEAHGIGKRKIKIKRLL